MWRTRMLVGLGALAAGAALPGVPTASAANGPAYRDCSLALGLDPDFVQLLGATVSPQGTLRVLPSQRLVQLEGSESSDPGDSAGHVSLTATVSSRQGTQSASPFPWRRAERATRSLGRRRSTTVTTRAHPHSRPKTKRPSPSS
jgi:hypothetical protein